MMLGNVPLFAALLLPAAVVGAPSQQVIKLQQDPAHRQPAASSPRKLTGRFLHITDFHPDSHYKPHTSTKEDIACHRGKGPAGYYGAETSDCDTPHTLVNATFDWLGAHVRDEIDFIIWTGDSARHDSDEKYDRSEKEVLKSNRMMADQFVDTFSDDKGRLEVPVIPTFGNNDILPHNIMLGGPNKWLKAYSDIWKPFIPEAQRHTFELGGWFYTEVIPGKLAVFSLNTLYFFERNAGIDDCTHPSEPGYKQMEWLRVQLQFLRERGMKAILMGHVPPARTSSKQNWDETCWQKYTLWLQQYRDVITASIFGHMNLDHYFFMDTEDININYLEGGTDEYNKHRDRKHKKNNSRLPHTHTASDLDQKAIAIQGSQDYLQELREDWANLPKEAIHARAEGELNAEMKGKKKKKHPLGGEWAERYIVSMVSPSIVPNYFPTMRIFEYNITGLEGAQTWADAVQGRGLVSLGTASEHEDAQRHQLELRSDDQEVGIDKKKKKKKGKKGKGPEDPYLTVPEPPVKTAPPGPAYSPQPLTLTGYTQYFANLTDLNNDAEAFEELGGDDGVSSQGWNEGVHKGKSPGHKPEPKPFKFQVEYTTFEDKIYKMKDLTVGSFVKLAYRIGREPKTKAVVTGAEDVSLGQDDVAELHPVSDDEEIYDNRDDDDSDDDDVISRNEDQEQDGVEGDGEQEEEASGKKKKKKGKKGSKNKVWLHFLKHAFVSTVSKKHLEKM